MVALRRSPYTAADYAQTNLLFMIDGIENAGIGKHSGSITFWKDLVGGNDVELIGHPTIGRDYIHFNSDGGTSQYGQSIANIPAAISSANPTVLVEIVFRSVAPHATLRQTLFMFGSSGSATLGFFREIGVGDSDTMPLSFGRERSGSSLAGWRDKAIGFSYLSGVNRYAIILPRDIFVTGPNIQNTVGAPGGTPFMVACPTAGMTGHTSANLKLCAVRVYAERPNYNAGGFMQHNHAIDVSRFGIEEVS